MSKKTGAAHQIAGGLDVDGGTLSRVGIRCVLKQEATAIAAELHSAYNRRAIGLEVWQNGREAP